MSVSLAHCYSARSLNDWSCLLIIASSAPHFGQLMIDSPPSGVIRSVPPVRAVYKFLHSKHSASSE